MTYYKDQAGDPHILFCDDATTLPKGCVEITLAEYLALGGVLP